MGGGNTTIIIGILGMLGSYFIACLAFAVIFQKARFPFEHPVHNLICALSLGPIAIAWLLWISFRFLPNQPYFIYVILTLLPFIVVLIFLRKEGKYILLGLKNSIGTIFSNPFQTLKSKEDWPIWFVWFGGIILLIVTAIQIFGMPLMASDPLEYAALSEVIYQDKSLDNYPLDPSTEQGFYARSSHPPAFHMMIVYSYIWQDGAGTSRLLRLIELHYLFAFAALLVLACYKATKPGRARNMALALSLLFAMSTPFYVGLVLAFHIDPVRIPLFMLGLVMAAALLQRETGWEKEKKKSKGLTLKDGKFFSAPVLLTGVVVGFGMFAHSIGILVLPFTQGAYFLLTRSSFWRRCAICTVFGLTALFVGAGQYVQNTIDFGVPFHDSEPIWELPQVDHKTDVRYRRNLVTTQQRIQNGLFVWFFQPTIYGWIHQVMLISLLLYWRQIWASRMGKVMLIGLLEFYAIAALTMSIGIDLVIKNIRYMLTIMPFLVVLAAIGGGELYARFISFTKSRLS